MKIPLTVLDEEITLTAMVRAPRISGAMNFLIDTGSDASFIGGIDMRRLEIQRNRLRFREEDTIFWGNSPFRLGKLRNVELWVKAENEKLHVFHLPYLYVSPDFIHTREGQVSPNILGLGFMRTEKLTFCFDGQTNTAVLEK